MQKLLGLTISVLALVGLGIAAPDHVAWSQAARTIRIVLSVPPGGSIDLLARILADYISKTNGQTIIIESKPRAGGIIAAEAVARLAQAVASTNAAGYLDPKIAREVFAPRDWTNQSKKLRSFTTLLATGKE